jgi:hypothetical protein
VKSITRLLMFGEIGEWHALSPSANRAGRRHRGDQPITQVGDIAKLDKRVSHLRNFRSGEACKCRAFVAAAAPVC